MELAVCDMNTIRCRVLTWLRLLKEPDSALLSITGASGAWMPAQRAGRRALPEHRGRVRVAAATGAERAVQEAPAACLVWAALI